VKTRRCRPEQLKLFEKKRPGDSVQVDVKVVPRRCAIGSSTRQSTTVRERACCGRIDGRTTTRVSGSCANLPLRFLFRAARFRWATRRRSRSRLRSPVRTAACASASLDRDAHNGAGKSNTAIVSMTGVWESVRRAGLRRPHRRPRGLGAPLQPRALLNGAQRPHTNGEAGGDTGATAPRHVDISQRPVSEHALPHPPGRACAANR
jgi:hypothetical protein